MTIFFNRASPRCWLLLAITPVAFLLGLLTSPSSVAYASCNEFENKFLPSAHLTGSPPVLADQTQPLVFCNLPSNQSVRVTALEVTSDKRFFSSTETFNYVGSELNTANTASVDGSYKGVEPDGYLWSMTETHTPPPDMVSTLASDPTAIVVKADVNNHAIIGKVHRDFAVRSTDVRDVRTDGIISKLFVPKQSDRRRVGIVLIPGAGGPNLQILPSYLLAARGYTVLSLAYYGMDGLPERLESVPLEYFSRAVDFLQREIGGSGHVVLVGTSRGTEAAAMVATQRNDISGLILISPSSVLNSAWGVGLHSRVSAWSLAGSPLPFMPSVKGEDDVMWKQTPPYRTRPLYELRLDHIAGNDSAWIPAHKISSDTILLSCDDDQVWPAQRMSNEIAERWNTGNGGKVMNHVFQGCGHDLGPPIAPTTGRNYMQPGNGWLFTLGGTAQATWHAQTEAWSVVLNYLQSLN